MGLALLGAEWVTAAGTVCGLYLVWRELKQNRRELEQNTIALRTASYQAMVANTISLLSNLVSDPQMVDLFDRALEGSEITDATGRARWRYMMIAVMRHFENLHYQHFQNTIDPDYWGGYERLIARYANYEGVNRWWQENRDIFSRTFQNYMNPLLPPKSHVPTKSSVS